LTLEAPILTACLDWLQWHKWEHWRVPLGPVMRGGGKAGHARPSPNPLKGFPDICVISKRFPGKLMAFEVKSDTGALRPEQKTWGERLRKAGVEWAVVRSLDDLIFAIAVAEGDGINKLE